jgi:predicted PurR-regulated permease PerM
MINFTILLKYAILAILAYLGYLILQPFLGILIITVIFTILIYPVFTYLNTKFKLSKNLSAFLTIICSLLFIVTPIGLFLSFLVNEAILFVRRLDLNQFTVRFESWESLQIFGFTIELVTIQNFILGSLNDFGRFIAQNGATFLSEFFNSIGLFIVFITLLFYMLRDGQELRSHISKLLPYSSKEKITLLNSLSEVSKTVFVGNLIIGLLSAIIATIGFYLFGFESVLIWGVIAFFLALVPTLGPIFLYLVGAITLFFTSGLITSALFMLYFVILELLFKENYFKSKFFDSKFNAHPILVLLSIVGGVSAFGSVGLLYGPIILVLFLSVLKFSQEK